MFAQHLSRDTSRQPLRTALALAPPRDTTERASEHGAVSRSDAPDASGLRGWHDLDWRFMLPDPNLGPVWLASDCNDASAALRTAGVDVRSEPDYATEVAFVDVSQCDFQTIERVLPPGALVRISVAGAVGLRHSGKARSWGVAEELKGRGWQLVNRVWAVGGIDAALGYIELDNRCAATYWWRTLHPRGARARLTVAAQLTLARSGLCRLLRHEGFVFARTPM